MKRTYTKEFKIKACELVTEARPQAVGGGRETGNQRSDAVPLGGRVPDARAGRVRGQGAPGPGGCGTAKAPEGERAAADGKRDLKKSSGILCEKPGRRIRFAKEELTGFDTSKVCQVLRVSRSGYYRRPAASDREKTAEENAVIHCFERHQGITAGSGSEKRCWRKESRSASTASDGF